MMAKRKPTKKKKPFPNVFPELSKYLREFVRNGELKLPQQCLLISS